MWYYIYYLELSGQISWENTVPGLRHLFLDVYVMSGNKENKVWLMCRLATIVLLCGIWTTKLARIYCSIDSSKRQLWLTSEESKDVKTKRQQWVKMDKRVKAKTWLEITLIISGACCGMTALLWNTVQCIPEELLRSLIDAFVETISMRFCNLFFK